MLFLVKPSHDDMKRTSAGEVSLGSMTAMLLCSPYGIVETSQDDVVDTAASGAPCSLFLKQDALRQLSA